MDFRSQLLRLLLGADDHQMAAQLRARQFPADRIYGAYPKARDLDKRFHALASFLASQKWGTPAARVFGLGKEGLDLLTGEGLDAGYDDMVANELGMTLYRQRNP